MHQPSPSHDGEGSHRHPTAAVAAATVESAIGSASRHRPLLIKPQRPVEGSSALIIPVQQLLDSGSEAANLLATLSTEQLNDFATALQRARELKEEQQQRLQQPTQNAPPSARSRVVTECAPSNALARNGAKVPHTSVITPGPRGPPSATTPILELRDNVPWMTFSYSHRGHINALHSIRIDINQVHIADIPPDFQYRNCLYPMANGPEQEYKGLRRDYERECNIQGWQLAHLNSAALDGERGLLQRAVNNFRNLDQRKRSRRMRRHDKVANGTLQKRVERPLVDFGREGVRALVHAPLEQQLDENCDRQGQERPNEGVESRVAGVRVPVRLKWKQILVLSQGGSSQGPTDLIVADPSIPDDDTAPQEAAITASVLPLPSLDSTIAEQTNLPPSLPGHHDSINLLEFQGYLHGQFRPLQIIVSIDQVQLDSLHFEFKKRNCVYPRSFLDTHESPHCNTFGIRQAEESYLNDIGWKLCWLNLTLLDGKKLLLQQALDAYRRKFLPATAQPRARIGIGLLTTRHRPISALPSVASLVPGQLPEELEQHQREEEPSQSSSQPPKTQKQVQRVRFNVQEPSRSLRSSVSTSKHREMSSIEEQGDSGDFDDVLSESAEEIHDRKGQEEDDDGDEATELDEVDDDDDDDDDDGDEDEEESGEDSSSEDVYHSQMSLLSFTGAIQTYSLGSGSGSARSRPRIASAKITPASSTPQIFQKRVPDRTLAGADKRPKLGEDMSQNPVGHNTGDTGSGSRQSAVSSGVTDNADGLGSYLPESDQQEEDDWWMSRLHSSHHPKDHYLVNMTTEELIGALTSGYNSDDDDDDDEAEEEGSESGDEDEDNGAQKVNKRN